MSVLQLHSPQAALPLCSRRLTSELCMYAQMAEGEQMLQAVAGRAAVRLAALQLSA